jgi:hypothetical protein
MISRLISQHGRHGKSEGRSGDPWSPMELIAQIALGVIIGVPIRSTPGRFAAMSHGAIAAQLLGLRKGVIRVGEQHQECE